MSPAARERYRTWVTGVRLPASQYHQGWLVGGRRIAGEPALRYWGWMMMQLYERIGKLEVVIAKAALAILTAFVLISAMARTAHYPVAWAVDAATFLFAWCVFLSGDAAIRRDKLVTIDILTSRLPLRAQYYVKLANQIIIIVFLAALVGFGFWLSYTTRLRTFQGMPGFSYTWVTLSVPIGSLLMLWTTILKVREQVARGYQDLRVIETKEFI